MACVALSRVPVAPGVAACCALVAETAAGAGDPEADLAGIVPAG